jgi:plastocyanin
MRAGSFVLAIASLLVTTAAFGHGPTVEIGFDRIEPTVLTIVAGQTVHFRNDADTSSECTVVEDTEAFTSPTLEKGGGWHLRFSRPAEYSYHIKERPRLRGKIVVTPK